MIDVQPFLDKLEKYGKMIAWKIDNMDQHDIWPNQCMHMTPEDIEWRFQVTFSVTPKKIRIKSCNNPSAWYCGKLNKEFDVIEANERFQWYKVSTGDTPKFTETGYGVVLYENAEVVK